MEATEAVLYLGKVMQQNIPVYFVLLTVDGTCEANCIVFESSLAGELERVSKRFVLAKPKKIEILNGKRVRGSGEVLDCEEIPPALVGSFLDSLHSETERSRDEP